MRGYLRIETMMSGERFESVKLRTRTEFWATIKVCVKVVEDVVMVLCYSDGIRGGNLGLMYNLLLQLVHLYSSPIDGLPENVRTKVSPTCL